jgi:hypothetical protein
MEITGCTKAVLDDLRRKDLVKASGKTGRGWALYDVDALYAVLDYQEKMSRPVPQTPAADMNFTAEQSAVIIRALVSGKTMDDLMIDGFHPRIIRGVMRERENLTGCIYLLKETVDQINQLDLEGNFPVTNAKELFNVLKIAAEERKCRRCKRRTKSQMCSKCERRLVLQNIQVKEPKKKSEQPLADEDDEEKVA